MYPCLGALLLASALFASPPGSGRAIEILQPQRGEILYGETLITAAPKAANVTHVLFYLDAFALPICRADAAPYECRFDAGTRFAGRTIRVDAYDAAGGLLGTDSVRTPDATEPIRVTRYSISVPIVATSKAGAVAELNPETLQCLYGTETCEVLAVRKLAADQALERQAPVHIEVLVDVSGSVIAFQKELERAATMIIDGAPQGTRVQLAEFAEGRRVIVPFTTNKEALRVGLARIGRSQAYSCVFRSMQHAAEGLAAQAGHRMLFVISDGIDTCDPAWTRDRKFTGLGIVSAFQKLKIPLYLFRPFGSGVARWMTTYAIYENLALATGGALFDQEIAKSGGVRGGVSAMGTIPWAAESVVADLKRTFAVDVGLPEGLKKGTRRRLELKDSTGIHRIRHQEYWEVDSRKDELLRMLYADHPATREKAAAQLAHVAEAGTAPELLVALQNEPVLVVRAQELIALYNSLIAGLLYGEEEQQRVAVKVSEQLAEDQPQVFDWLLPVARVYLKTPAPAGLRKRIQALVGNG